MKNFNYIALLMLGSCFFISCNKKAEETKPQVADRGPEMKARFTTLNECFNTGDASAIDSLLADDAVDHSEDTTMHLPKGKEGLKQLIKMFRESTPDLKSEIKMMAADGDILMVYGTTSGTNTGPMMGMPATNKKYSYDFVDIVRYDDNMKIKEHWGVFDNLKMMKDLGLLGGPPPDKKKKK